MAARIQHRPVASGEDYVNQVERTDVGRKNRTPIDDVADVVAEGLAFEAELNDQTDLFFSAATRPEWTRLPYNERLARLLDEAASRFFDRSCFNLGGLMTIAAAEIRAGDSDGAFFKRFGAVGTNGRGTS